MNEETKVKPIHTIGQETRVLKKSFLLGENEDQLYTKFMPQIKVNGKFHFIADANTPTGMAEYESKRAAKAAAVKVRDESIQRMKDRTGLVGEEAQ